MYAMSIAPVLRGLFLSISPVIRGGGGNHCQIPVKTPYLHGGGVGGVIDKCIIPREKDQNIFFSEVYVQIVIYCI